MSNTVLFIYQTHRFLVDVANYFHGDWELAKVQNFSTCDSVLHYNQG